MQKFHKQFLATALLGALIACGNGGGGGGGGDSTTADLKVNPLAKGELPKAKTAFYAHRFDEGIEAPKSDGINAMELTIDPEAGTFVIKYKVLNDDPNEYQIHEERGTYDPDTGVMTLKECDKDACYVFGDRTTWTLPTSGLTGSGRVILGVLENNYFGVSPTDAKKMPTGRATYEGQFLGTYVPNVDDTLSYDGIKGKAVTTVNFDTEQLDAVFSDFDQGLDDLRIEIQNAEVNGNQFGEGEIAIYSDDLELSNEEATESSGGAFFGNNAAEIGGAINHNDGTHSIVGAWNGERQ